jgi:hypothetical protein
VTFSLSAEPSPLRAKLRPAQKGIAMLSRNSRILDRVERLESQIKPKGRMFVFFSYEETDPSTYAEQLASFKSENNVGPNDNLHTVAFTFA